MTNWVLRAGKVFTPHQVIDDGGVVVREGRVVAVDQWERLALAPSDAVTDLRPHWIAPGFLDLHVHGAAGHDFMDGEDEGFDAVTRWHAGGGTTALLATTCAAPLEEIARVLDTVQRWQSKHNEGARVLGAHVEGPFFNLEMRGCHLPEFIKYPTADDVSRLLEQRSAIRHLTLAPELEGALDAVERLVAANISVAVAHSNATGDELDAARARGLRHVTHLFNAMSVYHQRGPQRLSGVVETALVRDDLTVELIADGFHVNPTRMRIAVRAKGVERVCVVTDAMRGAGMPDGLYAFGPRSGKQAFVRDGLALMPEGTGFASSTIPMIRCVQVMVEQVGVALPDALAMAGRNPARVIGLGDRKGELRPGMDADLVVVDEQWNVRMTIVEGRLVHSRDAPPA